MRRPDARAGVNTPGDHLGAEGRCRCGCRPDRRRRQHCRLRSIAGLRRPAPIRPILTAPRRCRPRSARRGSLSMRQPARLRSRLGARRPGRAAREAHRTHRRARQRGRRRRPLAGGGIGVGDGRCLHSAASPAELPRGGRGALHDRCDLVEKARRTCRAVRTRAARQEPASRVLRAARYRPSRPAALRARGRPRPHGSRSGRPAARPSGSSRRDVRERNMFRHTRATTVVNHPPRLSTPLASARPSRSQASCTASSASLTEPTIR